MAYTVYEYTSLRGDLPQEPPFIRTVDVALGGAFTLGASTVAVVVVPGEDMRLRVSFDGAAASSTKDHILPVDEGGKVIMVGQRFTTDGTVKLYGVAAA